MTRNVERGEGMRIGNLVGLVTLLLAVLPSSGTALQSDGSHCDGDCNLSDVPACEKPWRPFVSIVFLGEVVQVIAQQVPVVVDDHKASTVRNTVQFRVLEPFIGAPTSSVTITTGGDLCGMTNIDEHEKYVVYARQQTDGGFYVSACYGSVMVKGGYADADLKYLRSLKTAPSGAMIYGSVSRYLEPERPSSKIRNAEKVKNAKIKVTGVDESVESVTAKNGEFKISGLRPGKYQLSLPAENEKNVFPSRNLGIVSVADKGCARVTFAIDSFIK
jgi:hypothetical protein